MAGRDRREEEWQAAVAEARDGWSPHTGQYLLAHPLLAVHLEGGLEMLGYPGE